MTPISAAALVVIAALFSSGGAAVSAALYLRRERLRAGATPDMRELEQAVEELVRRLEATAGRCIHDLESRQAQVRALLGDESANGARAPSPVTIDGVTPEGGRAPCVGDLPTTRADGVLGGGTSQPAECFETDLLSRVARACELAERQADEATICRMTGMQRAELRLALSLRAAQQKAG